MVKWFFGVLAVIFCAVNAGAADKTLVRLETNYGDMTLELYGTKAPNTVANFLGYVNDGFYEGLIFHRVAPGFVIQAGAYDPNLYDADFSRGNLDLQDPNYYHEPNAAINLEVTARLKNLRGTVAMARQASPNTATSQFYINIINNTSLDPSTDTNGYAVFGVVSQGMDVADDIASVNLITDAATVSKFANLPVEPVIIERASVIREFDPNSYDLSAVPFLKASDGTVRTFVGQGAQATKTYRHIFSKTTYLDIQALKWKIDAGNIEGVVPAEMYLAQDTEGGLWILKYLLRPGTPEEQVVIQADNLASAVAFSDYAAEHMYFRLLIGAYSATDMNDPRNTLSVGTGDQQQNEQIISTTASLAAYPDVDLILVKWSRGPLAAPTDVDWRYYHPNLGLVFDLWDNSQNLAGDGWRLAAMSFNSSSANFAEVPFLKVPAASTDLVRTCVGQGDKSTINFTQTFSFPATGLQGVKYLRWVQVGSLANGIDSFTLNLARDAEGLIWVFHYELNGQTILDATDLLEAVPFANYNNRMLFRLINGDYNAADLADSDNTITTGAGATAVTEKIVSTGATLAHIPHFQGHLIEVKKWQGPVEDGNNLAYYDDALGLIAIALDGETGAGGNGWHLAFYGGVFSASSDDLSAVSYLHAKPGLTRTFLGQGPYDNFQHSFTSETVNTIKCLKWELTSSSTSTVRLPKKWYIHLARDNFGVVWVLKYYVNGIRVPYVGGTDQDRFKAQPISDFADYNLQFRLIAGAFDAGNLADARNTSTKINNVNTTAESLKSAAAQLPAWPGYRGAILRSARTRGGDPNTDTSYYHESAGLILDLVKSQSLADPNAPAEPTAKEGWRLGWYGLTQPSFSYTSSDQFSTIAYLKATPGQSRLYRGQGAYAGASFRTRFTSKPLLTTNTLQIEEAAVPQHNRPARVRNIARDGSGGMWLFKETVDGQATFAAQNLDQIMPFNSWPDIQFRLMKGTNAIGTNVIRAEDGDTVTDQIISRTEQLGALTSNNTGLALVRSLGTEPDNLAWTYYHQNIGPVLELCDDFYPPNVSDPNINNPAIILKDGAGWIVAEPGALMNLKLSVRAGANRALPRDYFTLSGDFKAAAADLANSVLTFSIGPWTTAINTAQLRHIANQPYYYYIGSPDSRCTLNLVIDTTRKTFRLVGYNTDLSGVTAPVTCQLSTGGFFASGQAAITGSLPILLMKGLQDGIATTWFKYINGAGGTRLLVTGTIITQSTSPDLAGRQVDISWGTSASQKVTIAGNTSGLRRVGSGQIFRYTSPTGKINYAIFNLENNTFTVLLNNIGALSFPVNLQVKITLAAAAFDQTAVLKVGS